MKKTYVYVLFNETAQTFVQPAWEDTPYASKCLGFEKIKEPYITTLEKYNFLVDNRVIGINAVKLRVAEVVLVSGMNRIPQ